MRVRYIVKEEEGIVVCLGEGTALDLAKDLGLINVRNFSIEDVVEVAPFLISESYKGVARLSKEDTWNVEIGKKVAYAKMMTKYLRAKSKLLGNLEKQALESHLYFAQQRKDLWEKINSLNKEVNDLF